MISPVARTPAEPLIVDIVPVRTERYTFSLPITEITMSLATTTMTTEIVTDCATSPPICTLNLKLPSDLNSTFVDGRSRPYSIATLTIITIILFSTTLFLVALYCIFIRFHSKHLNHSVYKEKPKKQKQSDIENATPGIIQGYFRRPNLEVGKESSQLRMKKEWMKALASLEGRPSVTGSVNNEEEEKEKTKHLLKYTRINRWPQRPPPVHIDVAATEVCRHSKDADGSRTFGTYATQSATHSAYPYDFLATRETENQRSLQGAGVNTFTELCNILNLVCQDHVLQGTTGRIQEANRVQNDNQEGSSPPSILSVYSQERLKTGEEKEQMLEPMAYRIWARQRVTVQGTLWP